MEMKLPAADLVMLRTVTDLAESFRQVCTLRNSDPETFERQLQILLRLAPNGADPRSDNGKEALIPARAILAKLEGGAA